MFEIHMRSTIGLLILFVISFGTNSCQKEFSIDAVDSSLLTPPPTSSVTGSFTATIDGVKFVANKMTAAAKTSGVIAITGQSTDGELIVLRVADSGVHVYSFSLNSITNAATYSKDTAYAYATNQGNTAAESGGTLSVTSIDTVNKKMSGTFSIKVYRQLDSKQKNITEGIFTNISYATEPLPPSNASDTFRVKVDGNEFPTFSVMGLAVFGKINLSASNQDISKTVGLSFPDDVIPGTYTFSSLGPDYIGQYNLGTAYMSASSGTLTILEHNTVTKRIKGNFNFNAKELLGTKKAALSEGYFSIKYQ
jgi:hypothetical protein